MVRYYKESDLEMVNEILEEAFSIKKSNFLEDEFHELVSEYNGVVSGYLLLTKVLNPIKNNFYYLIDYVCVSSKYRGLGLGDEMLKYAEEIAKEEGASYLQLTCGYQRISAHKLYERCGFIKRDSDIYRKVLE